MGMAGAIGKPCLRFLARQNRSSLDSRTATPIGLWIFAATATNTHWIAPILGSIPFGMGIVWTFR